MRSLEVEFVTRQVWFLCPTLSGSYGHRRQHSLRPSPEALETSPAVASISLPAQHHTLSFIRNKWAQCETHRPRNSLSLWRPTNGGNWCDPGPSNNRRERDSLSMRELGSDDVSGIREHPATGVLVMLWTLLVDIFFFLPHCQSNTQAQVPHLTCLALWPICSKVKQTFPISYRKESKCSYLLGIKLFSYYLCHRWTRSSGRVLFQGVIIG